MKEQDRILTMLQDAQRTEYRRNELTLGLKKLQDFKAYLDQVWEEEQLKTQQEEVVLYEAPVGD